MRNELRIGRLRGSGALISMTTAAQAIGGLATTLDIPKGHIALVTITAIGTVNNSTTSVWLELDGVTQFPGVTLSMNANVSQSGAVTNTVTAGRRALRVMASANAAAGNLDPANCTLSWIIAPQGGVA